MFPFKGKTRDKAAPNEWFGWSRAPFAAENTRSRIVNSSRGKAKVYVAVDDNIEPETDARVAAVCADSFIGKPSMKPIAFQTIFGFMNNIVLARRRPSPEFTYNAAAFFVFKDEAAWVLSGDASAIVFVDGEAVWCSGPERFTSLGTSPAWRLQLDDVHRLPKGETAVLLSCAAAWTPDEAAVIGSLLHTSQSPQAWTEQIRAQFPDRGSTMMAIFLPAPQHAGREKKEKE